MVLIGKSTLSALKQPVCLSLAYVHNMVSPDWSREIRGLFLESLETFRTYFGCHNSLCIFKTKASQGTKLCSYFDFYPLYNIWKDQLYRISRSQFYEWLFGPEKFSGLSRNGLQGFRNKNMFSLLLSLLLLLLLLLFILLLLLLLWQYCTSRCWAW